MRRKKMIKWCGENAPLLDEEDDPEEARKWQRVRKQVIGTFAGVSIGSALLASLFTMTVPVNRTVNETKVITTVRREVVEPVKVKVKTRPVDYCRDNRQVVVLKVSSQSVSTKDPDDAPESWFWRNVLSVKPVSGDETIICVVDNEELAAVLREGDIIRLTDGEKKL
jgi:hypothetical protein